MHFTCICVIWFWEQAWVAWRAGWGKMVSTLVLLPLLGVASAQWLHAGSVPGAIPALGSLEPQQAWILQQQQHLNLISQWPALAGRTKRSLPLPGTQPVLSLESNPQAKAEWYWALQAHQAQLAAHEAQLAGRKKRSNIVASLPLPGTSAVAALTPEQAAFWYQAQLLQAQNEVAVSGRKKRSNIPASLPVPGSAAVAALTPAQAAYWYQAQLQQAQLELGK